MNMQSYIDSLNIADGDTHRGDCPVCHGKNTFTVINEAGKVMYNCFKASCNVGGNIKTSMDVYTIRNRLRGESVEDADNYVQVANKRFVLPEYISSTYPSSKTFHKFLVQWNLNIDDLLYDIRQDRVVFPIFSDKNVLVDAVGRALYKGMQPKWMRYNDSPMPYVKGSLRNRVGVIVEDVISAYTVNDIIPSATGIALLGTQLTAFHKWYLSQIFDSIIVALDPDALNKTLSITKELRSVVPEVKAFKIFDDLKYANEDDFYNLRELVSELTTCR